MSHCANPTSTRLMRHLPLLAIALFLGACAGAGSKPAPPAPPEPPLVEGPDAEVGDEPEPQDPEVLFADALTLMRQGNAAEAEAAFIAIAESHPEYSGPHTNLGIIFATTDRRQAAINAFTKAAQANPQNAVAFNWLGILSRESRDYERAVAAFNKAIEADPDYPAPYINLGLLYERELRQPQQAVDAYRRYREVAGEDDLRVLPWIAELEAAMAPEQATEAAGDAAEESP